MTVSHLVDTIVTPTLRRDWPGTGGRFSNEADLGEGADVGLQHRHQDNKGRYSTWGWCRRVTVPKSRRDKRVRTEPSGLIQPDKLRRAAASKSTRGGLRLYDNQPRRSLVLLKVGKVTVMPGLEAAGKRSKFCGG